MKTLKFKTNLKCSGCVAKVKAQMDQAAEIAEWTVDLNSPDRILTVELKSGEPALIAEIFKKNGYEAELL